MRYHASTEANLQYDFGMEVQGPPAMVDWKGGSRGLFGYWLAFFIFLLWAWKLNVQVWFECASDMFWRFESPSPPTTSMDTKDLGWILKVLFQSIKRSKFNVVHSDSAPSAGFVTSPFASNTWERLHPPTKTKSNMKPQKKTALCTLEKDFFLFFFKVMSFLRCLILFSRVGPWNPPHPVTGANKGL